MNRVGEPAKIALGLLKLTVPWYELSQRLVDRAKADAERARLLDDLLDVLAGPPSPLLIEHGL